MTRKEMLDTSKEFDKERSKFLGNTLVCGAIGLFGLWQAFKNWGLANRSDALGSMLSTAVENSDEKG